MLFFLHNLGNWLIPSPHFADWSSEHPVGLNANIDWIQKKSPTITQGPNIYTDHVLCVSTLTVVFLHQNAPFPSTKITFFSGKGHSLAGEETPSPYLLLAAATRPIPSISKCGSAYALWIVVHWPSMGGLQRDLGGHLWHLCDSISSVLPRPQGCWGTLKNSNPWWCSPSYSFQSSMNIDNTSISSAVQAVQTPLLS